MMSKELLEETENKMVEFRQLLALVTGHNDILNKAAHIHEIVIKQAERVQELEKDIKEWEIVNECWEEINKNLAEQNKRYREAKKQIEEKYEYFQEVPSGLLAGLGIAIKILDEVLEGESE